VATLDDHDVVFSEEDPPIDEAVFNKLPDVIKPRDDASRSFSQVTVESLQRRRLLDC